MPKYSPWGDPYYITPGGPEGHRVRVYLLGRFVCACSDENTLAYAIGTIKLEMGL